MSACQRRFDRDLFDNKLSLSRDLLSKKRFKLHNKVAADNRAKGFAFSPDPHQERVVYIPYLEGLAQEINRIAREVWKTTGNQKTPDFLMMIFWHLIAPILQEEEQSIQRSLEASGAVLESWGTPDGKLLLSGAKDDLHREIAKIMDGWRRKMEIEAREMEHLQRSKSLEANGASAQELFKHSADFHSVSIRKKQFTLTDQQAQVVKMLWEAWENGTPDLGIQSILVGIDTSNKRLQDISE